ncbi:hypothetical protein PS645_03376 [Pseudomonas fluorescens]|uniref:Uncharacterized protein n=1 Tax=Pseudomonas fluorescens TaxID=294 RepID=A0A5E6UBF2_PSEFL|nr:hypothetical protein PS645_03376 [Pseudomonas fluorescens]
MGQRAAEHGGGIFLGNPQSDPPTGDRRGEAGQQAVMQLQQFGGLQREASTQWRQCHGLVITLQQPSTGQRFQAPDVQAHRRGALVQKMRRREKLTKAHDGMKRSQQIYFERLRHGSVFLHH